MMAAGTAAELGHNVYLIEKNEKLGRKLGITGKGRCNITNNCEIESLFTNVPTNSKFLYSAFYGFTNKDTVDFFNNFGVKTKEERGGRIFPESDRAGDVVNALRKYCSKAKLIHGNVVEIIEDGSIKGIKLSDGGYLSCDAVVLATGGASYPITGSNGFGYTLSKMVGHSIIEPKPSLVPLVSDEAWVKELQGLALKNVGVKLVGKKELFSDLGELLFTHFGLSGPTILSASAHMRKEGNYKIVIDLKPGLDMEKLDKRIQRDFLQFTRKQFQNSLGELFPKRLIPVIVQKSGIPPDKEVNSITKAERENLCRLIKALTVNVTGFRPIEEAIVTSGGVKTGEINPSTMESKLVKGLYFAGEIIDVDAYTGGFNLQIAFSTGRLAGRLGE